MEAESPWRRQPSVAKSGVFWHFPGGLARGPFFHDEKKQVLSKD